MLDLTAPIRLKRRSIAETRRLHERLREIALVLDVPIDRFFEGLSEKIEEARAKPTDDKP